MAATVHIRERVDFHRDSYCHLIKGLNKQRKLGEFCDVVLSLNGRNFCAHKAVLAATSPYFRSMFTSRMKEQNSDKVDLSESLLVDKVESFKQIIEFLYTGDIEITTDNAEDILRISDFLLLDDVKDFCKQFFLLHGNLNLVNCLYIGSLADQHNIPEVADAANKIIKSRFHDYLILSDEIVELPYETFAKLLKDPDIIQFATRDNIMKGILRWTKCNYRERQGYLQQLFACVQFSPRCAYTAGAMLEADRMISSWEVEQNMDKFWGTDGAWCRQAQCAHDNCNMIDLAETNKTEPVLITVACNSALRYLSMLVYRPLEQRWYSITSNCDSLVQSIPSRLSICAATFHENLLYFFLSYNLPYPTDMLRIHVMVFNVETKEYYPLSFRHRYNTNECCQTTLTDDRSIPPTMVMCNGCLCIIGNVEGSGHVFLCDITSQTYICYEIPGTRFVSLARAVVKDDALMYIWCRHRFGHEEYCINKEVSFTVFNVKTKVFTFEDTPPPPGIGYNEFSDPYVMCLEDNSLVVHTPGKPSLILDESKAQWLTHNNSLPHLCYDPATPGMPYSGFQLFAALDTKVYIMQNLAAYTTSLHCLSKDYFSCVALTPPPVDGISVVLSCNLQCSLLESLHPCKRFDDTYTRLLQNRTHLVENDDDAEGGTGNSVASDSDNEYEFDDFEYDEEIYGYYEDYEY